MKAGKALICIPFEFELILSVFFFNFEFQNAIFIFFTMFFSKLQQLILDFKIYTFVNVRNFFSN